MLAEAGSINAKAKHRGTVPASDSAITVHAGIHNGVSIVDATADGVPVAQGEAPSAAAVWVQELA